MRKRTLINKSNIIVLIIFLSIFFLSIGYSAFSATGRIENAMATVRPKGEARITSVAFYSATNGGVSEGEADNSRKILGTIDLPNADSTVTYKINATVFYSCEMKIDGISGLPSNLEYTLTDYTIGDTLCDSNNVCNLGATAEFYITFSYAANGYNSASTSYPINLDVTFSQVQHVAKVNNTYYESLQAAVNAAPNNTQTTVYLLMDTREKVTVGANKNIVFNFYNNTLRNNDNNPIIENNGTISISNGYFKSTAQQGVINNNGTLYLSGGDFEVTGNNSKQALYNAGSAYLSGDVMMTNNGTIRAVVQNLSGATMEISGGTYISYNYSALQNDGGTLVIGTQGGTPSKTNPTIRGKDYGVFSSTNYSFYDGILEGESAAVNDDTKITNYESGYDLIDNYRIVNNTTYHALYLGHKITVTFDPNQGTVSEPSRDLEQGGAIGPLPTPTRPNHRFDGWFTASSGGTQITDATTFNSSTTIYAHWTHVITITFDPNQGTVSEPSRDIEDGSAIGTLPTPTRPNHTFDGWFTASSGGTQITASTTFNSSTTIYAQWTLIAYDAKIDSTNYTTLDDAWTAAMASNTTKTIVILRDVDTTTKYTVASSKSVIVDLNGKTLNTSEGTFFEISNGGTFELTDSGSGGKLTGGKLDSSNHQVPVIVNKSGGNVTISGGTISSNKSQVIDNTGTMSITGGTVTFTASVDQGLINNNAGGTLNISGGTINNPNTVTRGQAVYNLGTLNISGNPVLTSKSKGRATVQNDASGAVMNISGGTISSTNASCSRGAVQNCAGATIRITGGTITSESTNASSGAVQNAGTLYVGTQGGGINTSSPVLQGKKYGVNNSGTFNYYDGILKGVTACINGTVSAVEPNSNFVYGTETIGSDTYNTVILSF